MNQNCQIDAGNRQNVSSSGDDLAYQSGFGNEYASQAVAGALPQGTVPSMAREACIPN